MPIRTINSPGVEIREIDKSQVAPAIVGTSVLVMGFSDKGEAYNPVDVVSVSDLKNNFGEPTNEAERYFYYACQEVINENGNLVAAKLPYSNTLDQNYKCVPLTLDADSFGLESATMSGLIPELWPDITEGSLSGSATITGYKELTVGAVEDITDEDYDTLVAGGSYSTGSADFVVVCERKNKVAGPNADEGLFLVVVDPVHGMVQQRVALGSDDDIMNMVTEGELAASTFIPNLSATYRGASVSEDMMAYFPTVQFVENGDDIDNYYGDWVTLVLCQTVANKNEDGHLDVSYLEAWAGSLVPGTRDPASGQSVFLGDVVNSQSQYLRFYQTDPTATITISDTTSLVTAAQPIDLSSFTVAEGEKWITGSLLVTDMEKVFEKVSNINERQIDVVSDAGLSTIAEFTGTGTTSGLFDPTIDTDDGEINSSSDLEIWRSVQTALDRFCKNIRKDCMSIGDGPRNLVIQGDVKYIRKTAPDNTFSNAITPKLKYLTGLNSNYHALYIDWMRQYDDYSGKSFWLPPTCKAAGIYVRNDRVGNIWDAPAGLNRGIVGGVSDIAFNPTTKEADQVYTKSMNYCKRYPLDGVVLEGQKTTQAKPSAFDRVNVRRLFLRLERFTYQVSRYFVMEPNNVFTRRRLVATLEPLFEATKSAGGLYDYQIICDETNNTAEVIDRNELKVTILLKPVRVSEFILVDFIATRTDADFSEFV